MNIGWLQPKWPATDRVGAISTYRSGGCSEGRYASLNLGTHVADRPDAVAENRRRIRVAAALPAEPSWLVQVHGVAVQDLDVQEDASEPADAVVTSRNDRVCAILTADCLPVLLTTVSGSTIGAAHAGWRGLAAGVIEAAVRAMKVPPDTLLAWLGPAIGPNHFEVGAEVKAALLTADPGASCAFAANARGRYMADLAMLARRRLGALGVARIFGCGECTYTHAEQYFSHRRDGGTGRQATLIWRKTG